LSNHPKSTTQLQINELLELTSGSLTCTVRCLAGPARIGDPVLLTREAADTPIVAGLRISAIQLAANRPADSLDLGRTAIVTAAGPIDARAVRAAAAEGRRPGAYLGMGLLLASP
jgi:hypothetical protein